MKQVVIGAGQVGSAITEVLSDQWNVETVDIDSEYIPTAEDTVIHICFPYSAKFEENVREYKKIYQPSLTIIHSTVPVGTSRRLNAVHSPITGKHPNLAQSVKTFIKLFGGDSASSTDALRAASIFSVCGVKSYIAANSETTEAGKLWQTLQYGWLIALQKEGYAWMQSVGADPRIAYDFMNETYNEGYEELELDFRLPTFIKDMPGPVGGHCVIPNTELMENDLATLLRVFNTKWENQE